MTVENSLQLIALIHEESLVIVIEHLVRGARIVYSTSVLLTRFVKPTECCFETKLAQFNDRRYVSGMIVVAPGRLSNEETVCKTPFDEYTSASMSCADES